MTRQPSFFLHATYPMLAFWLRLPPPLLNHVWKSRGEKIWMKISSFQKGRRDGYCYVQALVDSQEHTIEFWLSYNKFCRPLVSNRNLDDGKITGEAGFLHPEL